MNDYELTLVLPGKSKTKEKSVKEKVENLVEVYKGKIKKSESWGEITLSYKIKKETTGFFMFFELELGRESIKKLNEKFRLEGDIIRYLLVKKD